MVDSLSGGGYTINYSRGTMKIWLNDCCIMRSTVAEPGSLRDIIKIKAISREPGNPGWTIIPVRRKLLFMGELDDIKFQSISQDIADDAVIPLGADNQANVESNRMRITNNRKWSKKRKHRIIDIDHQKRWKGKNFTKCIKRRWDLEFAESKRNAQNLVDNASRFKKEG